MTEGLNLTASFRTGQQKCPVGVLCRQLYAVVIFISVIYFRYRR